MKAILGRCVKSPRMGTWVEVVGDGEEWMNTFYGCSSKVIICR